MKFLIYRIKNNIKVLNFKEIKKINHFRVNGEDKFVVNITTYPDKTGFVECFCINIFQLEYYMFISDLEDDNKIFVSLEQYDITYVDFDEE